MRRDRLRAAASSWITAAWPCSAAHIAAVVPRRVSLAFGLRAVIEQHLHRGHVAGSRRHHQGGFTVRQYRGVRVDAGFQEFFDHRGVAVLGGEEHRRRAVAIGGFGIGSGVDEKVGGFEIVPAGGPVEGGGAVGLGGVYVGVVLDECADGFGIVVCSGVGYFAVRCAAGEDSGEPTR